MDHLHHLNSNGSSNIFNPNNVAIPSDGSSFWHELHESLWHCKDLLTCKDWYRFWRMFMYPWGPNFALLGIVVEWYVVFKCHCWCVVTNKDFETCTWIVTNMKGSLCAHWDINWIQWIVEKS